MKTKTEGKHSPGPWKARPSKFGKNPALTNPPGIVDGQNDYVAVLGGGNVHFSNAEANAEFIVRACNTHDDLLEALKEARDALVCESTNVYGDTCGITFTCGPCRVRNRLDMVIAEAEGRVPA